IPTRAASSELRRILVAQAEVGNLALVFNLHSARPDDMHAVYADQGVPIFTRQSNRCHDPSWPTRRVPHDFLLTAQLEHLDVPNPRLTLFPGIACYHHEACWFSK